MTRDLFFREKFTKEHSAARTFAKEYFERYPKNRYQTEIENWRNVRSANIEFTIKRLRVPIRSSPVRNIEVTIDGVTHQGTYCTHGSMVYVQHGSGRKQTQIAGVPAESIAKLLLSELVREPGK